MKRKYTKLPFKSLALIGEDGVDHINIWENGLTDIGKALSPEVNMPFVHPVYGPFKSMIGFSYWVRSEFKDERMRNLYGKKAFIIGEKLNLVHVPNYRVLYMQALYALVTSYPGLVESLFTLEQPIDSYYLYGDLNTRIRTWNANWLIPGITEIIVAIKNQAAPDFWFLEDIHQRLITSLPKPVNTNKPLHEMFKKVVLNSKKAVTPNNLLPDEKIDINAYRKAKASGKAMGYETNEKVHPKEPLTVTS
jgi:hypothetical protein